MKKQGDIASLFRNHAAKKQKFIASSLSLDVTQASTPQEQEKDRINEEIVNPMSSAPPPPTLYDVSRLSHDPGERQPIASYHANDHDAIRRAYILRGPFQPYAHEFPFNHILRAYISTICQPWILPTLLLLLMHTRYES
jgi:hypothetical protein